MGAVNITNVIQSVGTSEPTTHWLITGDLYGYPKYGTPKVPFFSQLVTHTTHARACTHTHTPKLDKIEAKVCILTGA